MVRPNGPELDHRELLRENLNLKSVNLELEEPYPVGACYGVTKVR